MSKNIIEIALKAGFINTSNGLESPFIEGEDLTDNLKLFASLLLAQPEHIPDVGNMVEQEPVAWMQDSVELYVLEEKSAIRGYVIPLYTAPPRALTPREALTEYKKGYARAELDLKREPLSDEEVMRLGVLNCCNEANSFKPFGFARAIEKAHGITGVDDE